MTGWRDLFIIEENPKPYIDTSFVTGESPVTLDFNTDLGRNARDVLITNDGAGNFTYAVSYNGTDFSDEITLKTGETKEYGDVSFDSVRITWVSDSSYRVEAI